MCLTARPRFAHRPGGLAGTPIIALPMPIYEYRRPDGSTFELVQSFSDEPLTHDPDTGVPVQRVLHPPAVHFKGKGFYNTDYGTRKRQRETAAAAEGSSESAGDGAKAEKSGGEKGGESSAEKSSTKKDAKAPSGGSSTGGGSANGARGSGSGGSSGGSAKGKKSQPAMN
jgi:putative FmdB family regulatory protein